MAQRWWPDYAQPIRDGLVAIIQARRDADSLPATIEVIAGIHPSTSRFPARGIYVLPPGMRPLGDRFTPTEAEEVELTFQIFCVNRGFEEPRHLDEIGRLVSIVVDAVKANPTFPYTTSAGQVQNVEGAWTQEVRMPDVAQGQGTNEALVTQTLIVKVILVTTTA